MSNIFQQTAAFIAAVVAWLGAMLSGVDMSSCPLPSLFDGCIDSENFQQCLSLAYSGCPLITMRRSCPAEFVCMDSSTATLACPDVSSSPCMNQDNYAQCQAILTAGCQDLGILKSCPLQFSCNDPEPTTQCPSPTTSSCMNQDNYAQCRALEASGCQDLLILESCPLQFGCGTGKRTNSRDLVGGDSPDACVSLYVYSNNKCVGKPVRELTFPTWSKLGSPCCEF